MSEKGIVGFFNTPGATPTALRKLVILGMAAGSTQSYGRHCLGQRPGGEGDKVPDLIEKGKSKSAARDPWARSSEWWVWSHRHHVPIPPRIWAMEVLGIRSPFLSHRWAGLGGWSRNTKKAPSLDKTPVRVRFSSRCMSLKNKDTKDSFNADKFAVMRRRGNPEFRQGGTRGYPVPEGRPLPTAS